MFRTAMMSFSFSGMTLIRGFTGTLKAETGNDPLDKYKNIDLRLDDKDNFLQTISPDAEDQELGMAEPLTDAATRESKKDSMRVRMEMMMMKVQKDFCKSLENEENPMFKFQVDRWTRAEGGGGITCVLQDGHTFEKAGVNISVVHGKIPPAAVAEMNSRGKKLPEGKEMPFFCLWNQFSHTSKKSPCANYSFQL